MPKSTMAQHQPPIGPDVSPDTIDLHADGLLRCAATVASDPAEWMPFTRFDPDAEMLAAGCSLTNWRRYVVRCARRLEARGLALLRRSHAGMQLRPTAEGISHVAERETAKIRGWMQSITGLSI